MYISFPGPSRILCSCLVHLRCHRSCNGVCRVRRALQRTGEDRCGGALPGRTEAVPRGGPKRECGISMILIDY